jgi:hypothetical protein
LIIGHGDIASVLRDREDRVYFASGVSNSLETRELEYQRERTLLLSQDSIRHLVYFSSLSVFYSDTRYAQHKKDMENVVKDNFSTYTIIRLGNITWGKNPHTLINYLKTHRDAEIRNVWRYIVSREEFLYWIDLIPPWNCEMNIPGKRMKVKDIAEEYVEWRE